MCINTLEGGGSRWDDVCDFCSRRHVIQAQRLNTILLLTVSVYFIVKVWAVNGEGGHAGMVHYILCSFATSIAVVDS